MAQPWQAFEVPIVVPIEVAWRMFRPALTFDVTVSGRFDAGTIAVLLWAGLGPAEIRRLEWDMARGSESTNPLNRLQGVSWSEQRVGESEAGRGGLGRAAARRRVYCGSVASVPCRSGERRSSSRSMLLVASAAPNAASETLSS